MKEESVNWRHYAGKKTHDWMQYATLHCTTLHDTTLPYTPLFSPSLSSTTHLQHYLFRISWGWTVIALNGQWAVRTQQLHRKYLGPGILDLHLQRLCVWLNYHLIICGWNRDMRWLFHVCDDVCKACIHIGFRQDAQKYKQTGKKAKIQEQVGKEECL